MDTDPRAGLAWGVLWSFGPAQNAVTTMHSGGCLCGGVRYEVQGPLAQPIACHCSQCARTTGNYLVAASCRFADLRLTASATLAWFQSSAKAQRGFCSRRSKTPTR